jgi:8-oxo-dGTP diphosphatase
MTKPDPALLSDIDDYPGQHLAVDLVLMTIRDSALKVLMMPRVEDPFAGQLVLPGGMVHENEMLDDTARRVLRQKAGISNLSVEQLYTFSAPGRDPRGWIVSVAYFALMPCAALLEAMEPRGELKLVTIVPTDVHDVGLTLDGSLPVGAGFDHHAMVTVAVERLRGKLDWSMVAFGLVGEEFTLFEFQRVHELILGRQLNKPHFRKKMLERVFPDGRRLVPTGRFARHGPHRPAELYALGPSRAK